MAVNGREERKKLGGLKTMPFILSNEVCDRFAVAGFNANMILYLKNELHLPLVQATNTLNIFSGTSSFTPMIGALAADSFAGSFWTITVGSILYQLGMLGVTISAILPALRPPPCPPKSSSCHQASTWQQAFFYISLLITAVGSGGIRPCVVAFGADQLEQDGPHTGPYKPKRRWSFFNLYFFCIGLSVMLALTVVVYIQDNVGWGLGFGIPTIAMFISVIVFVAGYPLYIRKKPGGSPLIRMAQVVVAAVKKRKLRGPADVRLLYQDQELDADITTAGRLSYSKQFEFLNRAAIVTDGDKSDTGRPQLWRLSTVHRIEELKSFIRILPIWSVGILLVASAANNFTFGIIQAKTMNRRLAGDFHIPPATLFIFSAISMLLTLTIYDRIVVPLARRFTTHRDGISHLRRIGVGLAISILSNVASAVVENRRRRAAHKISVFWLVPQYAVHGVAEGLASVGLMEFLYDQSPESMRSISAALYWLSISVGHYGTTVLVTIVNDFTKRSKQGSWLQNNIDKGRLDYFYWLVAGLQVFNFGYYLVCAKFYVFKRLEIAGDRNPALNVEEKGNGEVELAVASQA